MEGGYFFPCCNEKFKNQQWHLLGIYDRGQPLYSTMKNFYVDVVKQTDKLSSHTSHKTGYLCMYFCGVAMIC